MCVNNSRKRIPDRKRGAKVSFDPIYLECIQGAFECIVEIGRDNADSIV